MSDFNYQSLAEDSQNQKSKEKERRSKLIYISLFTIFAFIIEYLIREPFTNLSESIQKQLVFESKCDIGSIFLWFKYQGKTFLFLTLYNISNVYVSLSMIFLDSFGIFINGIFKLFYTDPRPFWRNPDLVPCGCATNYGNPSTTSLDEFLVCIVIFRALINRHKNIFWKILIWIAFLTPQVLAWTSRFIQNIHSLPQLCFGVTIGYIIQYIYFEILEVNMEDSSQLKKLINKKSFYLIVISVIFTWGIVNSLHYLLFTEPDNTSYLTNINKYCDSSVEFFMFGNESYQKAAKAFLFLGSIVGAYIEYRFHFESNYDNYEKFAMTENNWTNSKWWIILLRIILTLQINKRIVSHFKFGNIRTDSLLYLNLGRCILKSFVSGLFYFWINKVVFGLFNLTNESNKTYLKKNDEIHI